MTRGRGRYGEYLASDHWAATRAAALERAGGRCQRCRLAAAAEVHHVSYARLGRERESDLLAVCRPCHAQLHGVVVGIGL
jgi:5-methylcytosine-specific restriction endonuclease McrA